MVMLRHSPPRSTSCSGLLVALLKMKPAILLTLAIVLCVVLLLWRNEDVAGAQYPLSSLSLSNFYDQPKSGGPTSSSETTCLVEAKRYPSSDSSSMEETTLVPQNSSTATVMAMATGYMRNDYQRFVGSLRKTGYQGNIILAVAPNVYQDVEDYLISKNVIIKKVQYVNCSHPVLDEKERTKADGDLKEMVTCLHPYPSLKNRWGRFPLLRDYLEECETCTGPVLVTDMRDAIFQRDPFGPEAPVVDSLQVFEEHYTIRTTNWLVKWPVGDCKGVYYDEPMLCSGTTVGTRSAVLEYFRLMHEEMDVWMKDSKCCCFRTNGDDQSIHNYLFYSGKLDHIPTLAIPNRVGLVHTVGAQAALIFHAHVNAKTEAFQSMQNETEQRARDLAHGVPFDMDAQTGKSEGSWLGLQYGLTDEKGYFVNYDGSRSFIAHQIDRFGPHYYDWLEKNREKLFDL